MTSLPLLTSNVAAAEPGPHDASSLHAATRTLIADRESKRHMGHHRVAESVVLDDVLHDALEPGTCPAT
jgi:hypothetical protein